MSCQNNLKQIGLALSNYHGDYGSFPLGGFAQPRNLTTGPFPQAGPSFLVGLLPYVDQQPLYTRLNLSTPGSGDVTLGPNGATIKNVRIPSYRCPSSTLADLMPVVAIPVFMPSYAGISGAAPKTPLGPDFPETRYRNFATCSAVVGQMSWGGVLVANEVKSMRDITDGVSNTIVVGESSAPVIDNTGRSIRMDAGVPRQLVAEHR